MIYEQALAGWTYNISLWRRNSGHAGAACDRSLFFQNISTNLLQQQRVILVIG